VGVILENWLPIAKRIARLVAKASVICLDKLFIDLLQVSVSGLVKR
jgi:hypothetical protein